MIWLVLYVAFVFGCLGFFMGAAWQAPEVDDSSLPKCPDTVPEWMIAGKEA